MSFEKICVSLAKARPCQLMRLQRSQRKLSQTARHPKLKLLSHHREHHHRNPIDRKCTMVLSVRGRTVLGLARQRANLERIYSKLGVENRTAGASFATELIRNAQ